MADPAEIARGLTAGERSEIASFDMVVTEQVSRFMIDMDLAEYRYQNIGSHPICIGYKLTPLGVAVRDILKGESDGG